MKKGILGRGCSDPLTLFFVPLIDLICKFIHIIYNNKLHVCLGEYFKLTNNKTFKNTLNMLIACFYF